MPSSSASHLSRRSLLRRAAATSALLAAPSALLAACSDEDEAAVTTPTSTTGFKPSTGSEIPQATVKFGMPPFPDGSFYVIAMKNGWYDEVGISIEPKPFGRDITPNNVVQLLINGDIDVATMNGPGIVRTMAQVPDLKMLTASDVYIATFLLASPDSGTTPVSELVAGGMGTAEAIKTAMAGVKGKGVGFNNAGSQRVFLDAVFKKYGGLSYDDVKLTVTDDAKLIQLAKGGQIQFATPDGSAQNVELLRLGWKPLVSVSDFSEAKDVPGAKKLVAASLSHEGPCAKLSYYEENTETMLRFISVMYRSIDELAKNPRLWADHVPYLEARNGIEVTVEGLQTIFKDINPFTDFDHQDKFWSKLPGNYEDYTVVYGEQIKAAQEGGVLPKDQTFKPEDGFIGPRVWGTLRDLQKQYDAMKKDASVKDETLAGKAQTHYDRRNYLDAVRLLTAATA